MPSRPPGATRTQLGHVCSSCAATDPVDCLIRKLVVQHEPSLVRGIVSSCLVWLTRSRNLLCRLLRRGEAPPRRRQTCKRAGLSSRSLNPNKRQPTTREVDQFTGPIFASICVLLVSDSKIPEKSFSPATYFPFTSDARPWRRRMSPRRPARPPARLHRHYQGRLLRRGPLPPPPQLPR